MSTQLRRQAEDAQLAGKTLAGTEVQGRAQAADYRRRPHESTDASRQAERQDSTSLAREFREYKQKTEEELLSKDKQMRATDLALEKVVTSKNQVERQLQDAQLEMRAIKSATKGSNQGEAKDVAQ